MDTDEKALENPIENPLALDDEGMRKENMRLVSEGVKSVGDGIKEVGAGMRALGNIAEDNRREMRWYIKIMLGAVILFGGIAVISLMREPENFTREYHCFENGYTTKFTALSPAIRFKNLFPNSTCVFMTQEEQGWMGFAKHKIGMDGNSSDNYVDKDVK